MEINFRKGGEKDLDEIFSFVQAAIKNLEGLGIFQWDEIYPDKNEFSLAIENDHLYLGELDGRPAVTYTLNNLYDEDYNSANWTGPEDSFCVLHRLVVNPAFQNKGVGKATMQHIEDQCRAAGIKSIRLDVFSQNPYSQRLYTGRGFFKTGQVVWRKGLFYFMEKIL